MINEVVAETNEHMKKSIDALRINLSSIRTGRASPALVERLMVDYYGVPTPLQQIATISVPDPQQLAIQPFDRRDLPAIERAIANSELKLMPNNDGERVRLNIPPLTEERRRELSKIVSRYGEEARVAIRNIRRDAINDLREFEKESIISEDDLHRGQDLIQRETDAFIKRVDETIGEKDKEIMTV